MVSLCIGNWRVSVQVAWERGRGVYWAFVNELFFKNFKTIFLKNIKSCKKIIFFINNYIIVTILTKINKNKNNNNNNNNNVNLRFTLLLLHDKQE